MRYCLTAFPILQEESQMKDLVRVDSCKAEYSHHCCIFLFPCKTLWLNENYDVLRYKPQVSYEF